MVNAGKKQELMVAAVLYVQSVLSFLLALCSTVPCFFFFPLPSFYSQAGSGCLGNSWLFGCRFCVCGNTSWMCMCKPHSCLQVSFRTLRNSLYCRPTSLKLIDWKVTVYFSIQGHLIVSLFWLYLIWEVVPVIHSKICRYMGSHVDT